MKLNEVLRIEDLRVHFKLDSGILKAVDGVSYSVGAGRSIGIIGESGSGKSVTARAIMRIVSSPGKITGGRIFLNQPEEKMKAIYQEAGLALPNQHQPIDMASIDERGSLARTIRGKTIGMIFQEPMSSLSPVHTIGAQITEAIMLHRTTDKIEAREIALDMLNKVKISNPSLRLDEYPHQLSGGMCQRAMIAMALSCNPAMLIADEPTTALDVTVQAQIIDLIKELQDQTGMAIQYITHDLGVIAEVTEDVAVMYLGRIVESGPARDVLKNPQHPYTKGLLASMPRLGSRNKGKLTTIAGNVPVPIDPPPQCGFYDRCSQAIQGKCNKEIPALVDINSNHKVRCFLIDDQIEEAV